MQKALLAILTQALAAGTAQAITLGQTDDFSTGAMGWGGYGGATYVPSGGPTGAGDGYIRLAADGWELGTYAARPRWAGNYLGAGVQSISMDLLNFGTTDLEMRILLSNQNNGATSNAPVVVPPDGQWHRAVFGLTASDLTVDGDVNALLGECAGFIIRHQPGPPSLDLSSAKVTSAIGIDNVTALPEPLTILLCAAGGLLLAGRRTLRVN